MASSFTQEWGRSRSPGNGQQVDKLCWLWHSKKLSSCGPVPSSVYKTSLACVIHTDVWCHLSFRGQHRVQSLDHWIAVLLGFGSPFVTGSQSYWGQIPVWQACSEEELHLWGRPARLGLGLCLFAVEKATWHRVSEATCALVSCPSQWGCVLLRVWCPLGPPEGGDCVCVQAAGYAKPRGHVSSFLCFSLFAWGLRCFFVLCCGHSQHYVASWGWPHSIPWACSLNGRRNVGS